MVNNIIIFDKTVRHLREKRVQKKWHDHNFLHDWAKQDLEDRLSLINRKFENIVELDKHTKDNEILNFEKNSMDQAISILSLHNSNDLPGLLAQVQNILKPDGLFIACLFGGETLFELRDCLQQAEMELTGGITPRIHPFADKQDIGALLQRTHYALPVIDSERIIVTYDTIFKLMHDLRYMGESNILQTRSKKFSHRELFFRANEIYKNIYTDKDGRLEATFEIIFALGWSPHESQQKPLKPGSAKERLSDTLKSKETKLPC